MASWFVQLVVIQLICYPEEVRLPTYDINLSFYCTFVFSITFKIFDSEEMLCEGGQV